MELVFAYQDIIGQLQLLLAKRIVHIIYRTVNLQIALHQLTAINVLMDFTYHLLDQIINANLALQIVLYA